MIFNKKNLPVTICSHSYSCGVLLFCSQPKNNLDIIFFVYCLVCRSILAMENTYMIKKLSPWPWHCHALFRHGAQVSSIWWLGFCFRAIAVDSWLSWGKLGHYSWFESSPVQLQYKNPILVTSNRTNFAATCFLPRFCVKKFLTSVEFSDSLLILDLSITNFYWLQLIHIQHCWVFCFLKLL